MRQRVLFCGLEALYVPLSRGQPLKAIDDRHDTVTWTAPAGVPDIRQIAALPYRSDDRTDGSIRVLLVTSRGTRRWVIPKGNAMPGVSAHAAAAIEAEEEAGVIGLACPTPIGSYRYRKRRSNGSSLMVDVEVFPLAVKQELPNWKEADERERRWFSLSEASENVNEPDLRDLIRSFAATEFRAAATRTTMLGTVAQRAGISWMFGWFQKLLPQKTDFFDLFEAHVATVVAGADALARLFSEARGRQDHIREINEREHDADEIIREVLHLVRRTFLTPFDRGTITSLVGSIDDSIDLMQSAASAIDLYEFTAFDQEMRDMVALIVDSTRVLSEAVPLLRNVSNNGKRLHELTERLVRMEGHADVIHRSGLKSAFQVYGATDPMGFIVRREIFNHLERITDALEDVANEIDGIVIDHA
jgi:predicted phosphate transport protein (TIGR00153 family)